MHKTAIDTSYQFKTIHGTLMPHKASATACNSTYLRQIAPTPFSRLVIVVVSLVPPVIQLAMPCPLRQDVSPAPVNLTVTTTTEPPSVSAPQMVAQKSKPKEHRAQSADAGGEKGEPSDGVNQDPARRCGRLFVFAVFIGASRRSALAAIPYRLAVFGRRGVVRCRLGGGGLFARLAAAAHLDIPRRRNR